MSSMLVLAAVLAIGLVGFFIGRQRAVGYESGSVRPHSRAHYHGWWVLLLAVLPAVLLFALWNIGSSVYIDRHLHAALPAETGVASESLAAGLVKSLAQGMRKLDPQQQKSNSPTSLDQNVQFNPLYTELRSKLAIGRHARQLALPHVKIAFGE